MVIRLLVLTSLAWAAGAQAAGDSLPGKALEILEQRCVVCHNESVAMSELRLLSREQALAGGQRGPAVHPGDAEQSLLYQAVTYLTAPQMPPTGKMPEAEIAVLREWIEKGAEWPERETQASGPISDWWAFQQPERPAIPQVEGARTPIDAFVLAQLQAQNLTPAPEADKLALIRRAYLDLHGLPPTPEQVRDFMADDSPNAYGRLLENLLSSPRYGEKWGRHWLDLVRYGDTSGFEQDPYNLEAWRYRDYVIQSFNDDKPYDRFVKEQLAGDEIWPGDAEAQTGTGYYRVAPNRDMLFKVEELNRVEKLSDYVDTTSTLFLGLTVGCARCHDHKFDPIPQRDFYRMQAIFAPAINTRVLLDYNPARFYDLAENNRQFRLRNIGGQIARIQAPYRNKIRTRKIATLPPNVQQAFSKDLGERTAEEQNLVLEYETQVEVPDREVYTALSPNDRDRIDTIAHQLVSMFRGYSAPPMAPGIIDSGREAPRTYVAVRGNPDVPGPEVEPGFLTVLGGGEIPEPPQHAQTTYRRRALAEWIASPENPLTARVIVNRIWLYHFDKALLDTPSDFGTRAQTPTHPKLLDWLATEFVRSGWSVKAMHRLIMTSDVYRRSSNVSPEAWEKDPGNQFLSRFNRRRMTAEEIRDAVLLAAGTLNLSMGGAPVVPPLEEEELYGIIGKPENAWVVTGDPAEHTRRSVYLLSRRTFRQPMFEVFDKPDGIASCSRRDSSTTAPQSLTLLNARFMLEQARELALQVDTVEEAWWRVYGRAPSEAEKNEALQFIESQTPRMGSRMAAFAELARSLYNSNEFLYVD